MNCEMVRISAAIKDSYIYEYGSWYTVVIIHSYAKKFAI